MDVIPGQTIFLRRTELSKPLIALQTAAVIAASAVVANAVFVWLDGRFAGSTLISQAIVLWGGLTIVAQMILRRAAFKARWGERGFALAFRWFAVPGLTFVALGIAHFVQVEGARLIPRDVALLPFWYLLISGIGLWLRSLLMFGIDTLSMMYVYFPGEGRLVDSKIYSVLRHPIYSVVIRITFALAVWNGSGLALLVSPIAPLTMLAWVRWVEEPELIERFGEGYREYRKRVPAFFNLNPRTWPMLWRFIIVGRLT